MRRLIPWLSCLAFCVALAACGNKGPLVRPAAPPAPAASSPAPATSVPAAPWESPSE